MMALRTIEYRVETGIRTVAGSKRSLQRMAITWHSIFTAGDLALEYLCSYSEYVLLVPFAFKMYLS